jgi:hypothetical protein
MEVAVVRQLKTQVIAAHSAKRQVIQAQQPSRVNVVTSVVPEKSTLRRNTHKNRKVWSEICRMQFDHTFVF